MPVPSATAFLFPRLLGSDFEALPPLVRALHSREGAQRYRGRVAVERGRNVLSRLCAWATRLPPAGEGGIDVEIVAHDGVEQWTRTVAGHDMRSRLWASDGLLCERLGLVTFGFRLGVEGEAITWRVVRFRALGLPLPAAWFRGVRARETQRDGRYLFDVEAALPLAGLLVHYRGHLDLD
ncbi:hypothetical protein GCM10027432_03020 [Lysobacter fragariae]